MARVNETYYIKKNLLRKIDEILHDLEEFPRQDMAIGSAIYFMRKAKENLLHTNTTIEHIPDKPFVGQCRCGHSGDAPNSDHADTKLEKGHGRCLKCDCGRFYWVGWHVVK